MAVAAFEGHCPASSLNASPFMSHLYMIIRFTSQLYSRLLAQR